MNDYMYHLNLPSIMRNVKKQTFNLKINADSFNRLLGFF